MGLFREKKDIPVGVMDMVNTSFSTTLIYGQNASFMVAERPGGYHSKPHIHHCEQLNYLLRGELYVYTEKEAFLLKDGDVLRIPPSKIHWAWNKADTPCVLLEVHSPGLQDDPHLKEFATGLFDDEEEIKTLGSPINTFVNPHSIDIEGIESLKPSN